MGQDRITLLGLGNILLSDEGFGVRCLEYLQAHYRIPPEVELVDGGTAGMMLAHVLEDSDELLVIDSVAIDEAPGSIHCFSDEDLAAGRGRVRLSPHQMGLLEVMELCRFRGHAPRHSHFFTVVPQSLETSLELTPLLTARLEPVSVLVTHHLERLGKTCVPLTPHA